MSSPNTTTKSTSIAKSFHVGGICETCRRHEDTVLGADNPTKMKQQLEQITTSEDDELVASDSNVAKREQTPMSRKSKLMMANKKLEKMRASSPTKRSRTTATTPQAFFDDAGRESSGFEADARDVEIAHQGHFIRLINAVSDQR